MTNPTKATAAVAKGVSSATKNATTSGAAATSTGGTETDSYTEALYVFLAAFGVVAIVATAYHYFERRNRGGEGEGAGAGGTGEWKAHLIYWAAAIPVIVLVSGTGVAPYVFSELTITLIGALLPVYESIRAICTADEQDDKEWLQYWMFGGVLYCLTTWVDDVLGKGAELYWDEILFFLFVWLYFPKTDGAALIYENITKPYVTPLVRPLADSMKDWISYLYQTMVNAVHLWIVWIIFLFLPRGLKRIVAVLLGTVYPLISSITAASTIDIEDDTYWLTYWSCYGVLFVLMDIFETWLGWIPGFYTLVIFCTIYLMLPMFGGAEKIFRKILVPLAGLREMLLLRDAIQVKKSMLRDLPPERATQVRKAIAKFYDADDDGTEGDPASLKRELMSGYQGMSLLPSSSSATTETTGGGGTFSFLNPFAKKGGNDGGSGAATENTTLIV